MEYKQAFENIIKRFNYKEIEIINGQVINDDWIPLNRLEKPLKIVGN